MTTLFPLPSRAVGRAASTTQHGRHHTYAEHDDLRILETLPASLGNALILLGHPFRMNLLKNVARWSWTQLTSELAPPFRLLTRRACRAQLHILVNGTVQYQETTPTTRCCSLLHALKATPPPPVYGVIDLEAMGHRERCSASLKALGAVMDTTRSLIDRLMSHQATVAHMNLRLGSAVATSYEMHYDNVDNVLLQLAGRKRLLLAPPSQIRHAHMGEPRCGPGGVPSTSVPHARHSPIDWRAPREQIDFCFPRASRLQALRVSLNAGEALFLPARWLHYIIGNEPPDSLVVGSTTAAQHSRTQSGTSEQQNALVLPWLSVNAFFYHNVQPQFKIFDSCDNDVVERSLARMPAAHKRLLAQLRVERARAAYCE